MSFAEQIRLHLLNAAIHHTLEQTDADLNAETATKIAEFVNEVEAKLKPLNP